MLSPCPSNPTLGTGEMAQEVKQANGGLHAILRTQGKGLLVTPMGSKEVLARKSSSIGDQRQGTALQPCHMQLHMYKHTGMKGLFLVHSPKKTPCFCSVLWFLFK